MSTPTTTARFMTPVELDGRLTRQQCGAATRYVNSKAHDADDARLLLQALGLIDYERDTSGLTDSVRGRTVTRGKGAGLMGCYDTLIDQRGNDWQTKALGRGLRRIRIGDSIGLPELPATFQVEILGEPHRQLDFVDSLARFVDGVLVSVDEPRFDSLPLVDYGGNVVGHAGGPR